MTDWQTGSVWMVGVLGSAVGDTEVVGPVAPERQRTVSFAGPGSIESKEAVAA